LFGVVLFLLEVKKMVVSHQKATTTKIMKKARTGFFPLSLSSKLFSSLTNSQNISLSFPQLKKKKRKKEKKISFFFFLEKK